MSQEGSNQQTPAGQPENASANPPEQSAGQQKFLTMEEARRLFAEELRKSSQATVDRVTNQVKQVINAAAAKGVTLTADQAQAVIDASASQVGEGKKTSAASSDKPAEPAQATPPAAAEGQQISQAKPDLDPVTKKAVTILSTEYGLTVDPDNLDTDDPDTKLIDLDTDDPEKFFASIRAYGKVKKEKAEAAGTPPALPGLASGGKTSASSPYEGKRGRSILSDYYTKHT